ncbi:MAG TPA: peptidyl-prolyl cis-trans isomerase [Opitutaceae bacterium]|nr:peptidyl-prolyl cis-trans isomerase [Opitutaceae bacterium]
MISWIQRTFQNHFRAMFAVMLGLTILSFVIAYAPSASSAGRTERQVEKKPFFDLNLASQVDVQRVLGDAALSVNLQAGYMGFDNEQLQQYALQRYATLHLADQLHIPQPTADDLAGLVKGLRAFAGEDGQFDAKRYATFRDSLKTNARLTEADVTRVLAADWRAHRVEDLIGGPGYVLPADVRTQLVQSDSTWTIAVATADYAAFSPAISPSAADLAKFFDENSFRYEIPPRVSVSYVEFPAADFASQVNVTDDDAKAYYSANPGRFPKPADPKAAAPAKDAKADPAADFLAVRPQVVAALKFDRAQRLAVKAASDFAYSLFDGKVTAGPALDAQLAAHKLTPKPLAPFTHDAGPAEFGGSPQIADAAFKLSADHFYSDALTSPNGSVVLFWKETLPSRKPLLAEVHDKVVADYQDSEKQRRFIELGKTMKTQIEARLKAGDTFEQAANAAGSALKLQVKSPAPFTLRQPPQGVDYSVLGALEHLDKGQVSDLLLGQDKAGSFVYVVDKKAPDLSETSPAYLAAKAQLAGSLARYNTDSYLQELVAQEEKKSQPAVQ